MSPAASGLDDRTRLAVHHSTRWSTRIEVLVTDPAVVVAAARILDDVLDRVEEAASRFRPDSELSRIHQVGGGTVAVSGLLCDLLATALRAADLTDGLVDPTVGAALVRLGYDRDFSEVAAGVAGSLPTPAPVPGWRSVALDADLRSVAVPAGTILDLGATAKAWAADRAASTISEQLGCGALVSLGGDVAVRSAPVGVFVIGVADVCGDPAAPTAVAVSSGGLATSGIGNRHWSLGDTPVHHVVDPRTGLPTASCWRTVTVAAGSCVDANTASTAGLVLGEGAPDWLAARQLPSRLVRVDGTVVTVAGWPADTLSTGEGRS